MLEIYLHDFHTHLTTLKFLGMNAGIKPSKTEDLQQEAEDIDNNVKRNYMLMIDKS